LIWAGAFSLSDRACNVRIEKIFCQKNLRYEKKISVGRTAIKPVLQLKNKKNPGSKKKKKKIQKKKKKKIFLR